MRIDHDECFIGMAKIMAQRSACLSRQVGCVLVDGSKHVLSTGYNGPPVGIEHCHVCHRKTPGRDLYSCSAVHAEQNALLQCPDVGEIYRAYVSVNPCMVCARMLANTSCNVIVFSQIYTEDSYNEFIKFWEHQCKRKAVLLRK